MCMGFVAWFTMRMTMKKKWQDRCDTSLSCLGARVRLTHIWNRPSGSLGEGYLPRLAVRGGFARLCLAAFMALGFVDAGFASQYEVSGYVRQTMFKLDGRKFEYGSRFTVFVRDCGWMIKTIDENGTTSGYERDIGSTNGSDIFEYCPNAGGALRVQKNATNGAAPQVPSKPVNDKSAKQSNGFVRWGNLPVGLVDQDIVGHLWLMFASQCYWSGLETRMLTPLYNYRVSVPADPKMSVKVMGEWELLAGRGSLPQEVRYLNQWDETNGLYRAVGTVMAGATMLPDGFIFEERQAQPFPRGMVLRKVVRAEVTSVRAVCSLQDLIPAPEQGTVIVDWRLVEANNAASLSSYVNPKSGKWPSLAESRELARANAERNQNGMRKPPPPRTRPWMVAVVCAMLLAPLSLFLRRKKA
jgi:hypothetical protein